MATYYINVNGSNTSPFDTPAKGATTFTSWYAYWSGVRSAGDIIEVLQGTYDESALATDMHYTVANVTIRSYSANTQKPHIVFGSAADYAFYLDGGPGTNKLQNIHMEKAFANANGFMVKVSNAAEVSGCIIHATSFVSGYGYGISAQSQDLIINLINNVIYNVDTAIYVPANFTGVNAINNTVYNCTKGIVLQSTSTGNVAINNAMKGRGGEGNYAFNNTGTWALRNYNTYYNFSSLSGDGPQDVVADPLYVNEGTYDLRLQSTSPCRDSGADTTTYPTHPIPTIDALGVSRPQGSAYDRGAYEYQPPHTSLSYFASSSVSDGTSVQSNINTTALVSAIQSDYADNYFDDASKITRVVVYYTRVDERQIKKVAHEGLSLTANVSWSSFAKDGAWNKTRIKVFNHEGATHNLYRASIGTLEDLTHGSGSMTLNVS